MDLESKYNTKSPAVKRLMREAIELREATDEYCARPLEDNLFEWHFTVQGPPATEFENGIYHGRILLPPDYPMKPPNIILLTPNGRFKTNKKICLSISGHHPETWQPSWSIRTALLALIAFMPSPGNGTIGSLDYKPEERKQLARKSQTWECSVCGKMEDQLNKSIDKSDNIVTPDESNLINNVIFKGEEPCEPTGPEKMCSDNSTQKCEEIADDLNESARSDNASAVDNSKVEALIASSSNNVPEKLNVTNNSPSSSTSHSMISDSTSNLLITVLVAAIALLLYRRIFLM